MEYRAPLGQQKRPPLPQRAVSGGSYGALGANPPRRPNPPSRLSNIRSVSQPVALTAEAAASQRKNAAAFRTTGKISEEEVVQSPDAIKSEDEDGERPAKRAKTSGDSFRIDEGDDGGERDKAHEVVPGSPLPKLPKTKAGTERTGGPQRQRSRIDSSARKAHGTTPPTIAIRVPGSKRALDFSPWLGNHAEDLLNETVIKTGYFDKAPSNAHVESNSAKSTIWPSLSQKNPNGLTLLCHLFTAVMEKRQAIGRCTAPSTFKPPPRVTVTDTKREAWLRDLANIEIPLRKQSRTIPHGIRGKLLMEQCLGKAVPLQRALWLAKCVGANELRAFRRKGVSGSAAASGELKWVRDWTVQVEQFVEGVILKCGQPGWQHNMNYAVKLVTAFYGEKLLETDHYLDWIVSSLRDANLDRLPLWIIIAQIYWKEITVYGRRGRKLAESILGHLHRVTQTNANVYAPLKLRLQKLVGVLAVYNRGCLIIPKTWEKYKYLLAPMNAIHVVNTATANITARNERLAGPASKTAANTRSSVLDLYDELDSAGLDFDHEQLSRKCLALIPDASQLVPALLEWASTKYRTGVARVYLAANIIAYVQRAGHDTDTIILQYLRDASAMTAETTAYVHKVIVALVDLKAFSIGRYLQWLITSGVLSAADRPGCATGLLAAIPTKKLTQPVLNTRNMLMRRLGYNIGDSELVRESLEASIYAAMTSAADSAVAVSIPDALTASMKQALSEYACARFCNMAKDFGASLEAFCVARNVIERTEDIKSLATLITATNNSDNSALLATAADTTNLHAESFAALDEFKDLVAGVMEQYLLLRSQQPLDRTLILALTSLAHRIPDRSSLLRLLNDDLAICEQQNSLAVCSPASDNVIGMHASILDSDEDIDAVFASGNTMDEQLMQRVFTRIVQRALKPQQPATEPVSKVSSWFNQLRSVGETVVFDRLAIEYVRTVVAGPLPSFAAIICLVGSGCMSLGAVADAAKDSTSPHTAASLLPLFIARSLADAGLHECEQYRYRLQQECCQVEHVDSLNTLLRTACGAERLAVDEPELLEYVIRTVAQRPGSILRIFEDSEASKSTRSNACHLISAILSRGSKMDISNGKLDAKSLVNAANPLSVRYCVGALRYFRGARTVTPDEDEDLATALRDSFNNHSQVWPQLFEFAGEHASSANHEWAQARLLRMASDEPGSENECGQDDVKRFSDLLAITSRYSNTKEDPSMGVTYAERLKELEKDLLELNGFETGAQQALVRVMDKLRIMLHLCAMHVHVSPNDTDAARSTKASLLAVLCSLLVNLRLQTHRDLLEYLFDLCSMIADGLPDASHVLSKIPSANKLPADFRLTSIFGPNSSSVDSWLALVSQVQPPGTQQQRALSRAPSQSQQFSPRTTAPGPLQPSSQQHQRTPSSLLMHKQESRIPVETKMTAFPLRRWEMMSDPTPVMGENDASLSLSLFGARKV